MNLPRAPAKASRAVAEPKLDTLQSIELAEGVQILLRPAGPLPRAWALLVDMLLVGVFFVAEFFLMLLLTRIMGIFTGIGTWLLLVFLTYWGYFVLYEVLRKGQTPGKKMMGLRVVRTSGERVGWGASFLRNLVRFGDMMPLSLASGRIGSSPKIAVWLRGGHCSKIGPSTSNQSSAMPGPL